MTDYDLWVDSTLMHDEGRLRTRLRHARPGSCRSPEAMWWSA
jgi:hypothetical protein